MEIKLFIKSGRKKAFDWFEAKDQKQMFEVMAGLKDYINLTPGEDYEIYMQFPSKMNNPNFKD